MTNYIQLPDVRIQPPREDLENGLEPLGKVLLYSKGIAVKEGRVRAGHFGIPEDDKLFDLGNAIDLVPLARRLKAVDTTNADAVTTVYDCHSPEFNRIFAQYWKGDDNCMCGTSFLIFERSSHRFLEFFCGIKNTHAEAGDLTPCLPLTAADIDCQAKYYGRDVSRLVPHGPQPLTLKSRRIKKGSYSGYAPLVTECLVPFTDLPSPNDMIKEIQRFIDESRAEWWRRLLAPFRNNQRPNGKAEPSRPTSAHQRKQTTPRPTVNWRSGTECGTRQQRETPRRS